MRNPGAGRNQLSFDFIWNYNPHCEMTADAIELAADVAELLITSTGANAVSFEDIVRNKLQLPPGGIDPRLASDYAENKQALVDNRFAIIALLKNKYQRYAVVINSNGRTPFADSDRMPDGFAVDSITVQDLDIKQAQTALAKLGFITNRKFILGGLSQGDVQGLTHIFHQAQNLLIPGTP